jgi:hypothetical protein
MKVSVQTIQFEGIVCFCVAKRTSGNLDVIKCPSWIDSTDKAVAFAAERFNVKESEVVVEELYAVKAEAKP